MFSSIAGDYRQKTLRAAGKARPRFQEAMQISLCIETGLPGKGLFHRVQGG